MNMILSPSFSVHVDNTSDSEPLRSGSEVEQSSTVDSDFQNYMLEQIQLTNHILIGIVLFLGIIVGCICMKLFWDRFRK